MKVENFNQNYANWGNRNVAVKQNIRRVQPQFTGSPAQIKVRVEDLLPNKAFIKFMEKFKVLKGELGGILITAAGTGLVAPIFIAYNPFVKAKKDATEEEKQEIENTKKYTAMRQPISAVLAALFQAGALGPIDKFLEKMSNDPEYSKNFWLTLDQSALQKKSYLERQIRKEMKNEGTKYANNQEFKAELAKRVKAKENEQISNLAKVLEKHGEIKIGNRAVDNKTIADVINKQIDAYIDDANKMKIQKGGYEFYVNRATALVKYQDHFKEIFNPEKLPKNEKALETYLMDIRNSAPNKEVKDIIQEILEHPANVRESRCKRTLERIDNILKTCGNNYTPGKYFEVLLDRNSQLKEMIESLEALKITDAENINPKKVNEIIEEIARKCHYDIHDNKLHKILDGSGTFQTNLKDLKTKIHEDIIKGYKKLVENKFKGFSQMSKVAIGVSITLPITCTMLNWVYPRFMDIAFPSLSGKKSTNVQKNGGEK